MVQDGLPGSTSEFSISFEVSVIWASLHVVKNASSQFGAVIWGNNTYTHDTRDGKLATSVAFQIM